MPLPAHVLSTLGDGNRPIVIRSKRRSSSSTSSSSSSSGNYHVAMKKYDSPWPGEENAADGGDSSVSVLDAFGVTQAFEPNQRRESCVSDIVVEDTVEDKDETEKHDTMIQILRSRLTQIKAVKALYIKNPELAISHITKLDDLSLAVDIIPQLMERLGNESTDSSQKCISMAAAFELLPIIRMLLRSPYEDYQMIGVDAISTMVARWKPQLVRISKAMDAKSLDDLDHSISTEGMCLGLIGIRSIIEELVLQGGQVAVRSRRVLQAVRFL